MLSPNKFFLLRDGSRQSCSEAFWNIGVYLDGEWINLGDHSLVNNRINQDPSTPSTSSVRPMTAATKQYLTTLLGCCCIHNQDPYGNPGFPIESGMGRFSSAVVVYKIPALKRTQQIYTTSARSCFAPGTC